MGENSRSFYIQPSLPREREREREREGGVGVGGHLKRPQGPSVLGFF